MAVLAIGAFMRFYRLGANRLSAMIFLILGGGFFSYAITSFGALDFTHGPAYLSLILGGALYYVGAKLSDSANARAAITLESSFD